MKITAHASLLLLIAALAGCSSNRFKSGHGDVGTFILQQAVARGGRPHTNSVPPVPGSWRYFEDKDGVVIRMSRKQYPAVEVFLRHAFGEPDIEPTEISDGGRLGVYRLSSKGGGIQFGYDAKETQIIVLRPLSTKEILRGVAEAMKDIEDSK